MLSELFVDRLNEMPDQITDFGLCLFEKVFNESALNSLCLSFEGKIPDLQKSSIGRADSRSVNTMVRSDKNVWLLDEDHSFEPIWQALDLLTLRAKKKLFLPLKRYEAQMALYPPGAFYSRHKDQHQHSCHRLLSVVFYLNDWSPGNGGELMIYNDNGGTCKVKPKKNQLIIFRSELEHEVVETLTERKSISAWLRSDIF